MAEQDNFHEAMKEANVEALWEIWQDRYDRTPEQPFCWPWKGLEPLMLDAAELPIDGGAERRVLCLRNPIGAKKYEGASPNFYVNVQALNPGEEAPVHRHSMGAMRFILKGGAVTTVDGKACPMEEGDLILTPGWTWHEHNHKGSEIAIWADILDAPLHRHFDTGIIEPGPAKSLPNWLPDQSFAVPGFTPVSSIQEPDHSTLFRYAWSDAQKALQHTPIADDGSRLLRYTDPVSGGSVLPYLDCFLLALANEKQTTAIRSTANSVAIVVAGSGLTKVSDVTVTWTKNDIFSLPHGNWISHQAAEEGTTLFIISDRQVLQRLGLLKEEPQE
jgi:gentisate 1,2-dioxygenase